ncbi:MAG: response regulator [Cyanobacteria bacterium RI_101]|nr:response regulator [Cyanobacteria bacterium RI_101]
MTTLTWSQSQIPADFLAHLVNREATGKLIVQNPLDEFVTWQVYLGKGKIHFANSGAGGAERLKYLLGNYLRQRQIQPPQQLADDYQYLSQLWKTGVFSFQQTRSVLTQFTQEALVQVLSLPKTTCTFDDQGSLKHLFLNLELNKTVTPVQHKIKYWWALHSYISSPFQRPLIEDWQQFQTGLPPKKQNDSVWLGQFAQALKDLSCLYEIARATHTSVLEVALLLRPQIKRGEVKMLSYQEWQAESRPLVISVNQHPSVQKVVQSAFEQKGAKTLCLDDPCQVLAAAMSQKPSLILIDAEIPQLNGYELCRLLRRSPSARKTPIVLMSPQVGLAEKVQGKLSQVSGHINRRFLLQELAQVAQNYLAPSATSV